MKNFNDAFKDVRETMMRNEWHPVATNVKQTRKQKDRMRTEANAFL